MASSIRLLLMVVSLGAMSVPAFGAYPQTGPVASPVAGAVPNASRSLGPVDAVASGTGGEALPATTDGPSLDVMRTVGSLGLVIVLIGGLAAGARWVAKKQGGLASQLTAGGRAPSGVAEVLARYPMGRGQTVVLMHIGDRVLVTFHAVGGKNGPTMTLLSEVTDAEEVADLLLKTREPEAEAAQTRFAEAIAEADARHTRAERRPKPSPFRTVQTSPEGDRVELLGVNPQATRIETSDGLPERDGLDAVTRLRERLAGIGVGSAS